MTSRNWSKLYCNNDRALVLWCLSAWGGPWQMNMMGDDIWGGEKKEVVEEEAVWKASGLCAEAWTRLLSADYCHSWENLWVWVGNPLAFSAFFNKAWIEWARSLSLAREMLDHKQQANNWSCYCCACDLASVDTFTPAHAKPFRLKCPYLQLHENFLFTVTYQTVVHVRTPTHKHSRSGWARPDCCGWRYVVESSITKGSLWSNQVCPDVSRAQRQPSKDRP